MLPQDTAYFYLNTSNQLVMRVQWVDPPSTIVYINSDGSVAADADYPLADDAVSFTLYNDGSLESYRNIGGDGSYTWLKFAQADPGESKIFGPNSEYSHGDLIYSETLDPDTFVHEVQTFEDGNRTSWELSFGSLDTSAASLVGSYDSATGTSTLTLANASLTTPITVTGQGFINDVSYARASLISDNGAVLIGNDGSTLIGNDGSTLIGNDGSTLNLLDVFGLIGNDGSTLIGNDGSTLLDLAGGASSLVGPAYSLTAGNLVGVNGSALAGSYGVSYLGNALSNFRGYSALTSTSFEDDVDPPVDSLSADTGTTGEVDIFGKLEGEIETAGDRDWVRVELKAGETYSISVDGADSADGTLGNPHVRLYDGTGTLLGENADSGAGDNARLTFTPTADGVYYVEASGDGDTGVGTFEIGVHRQATAFIKDGSPIANVTGLGFLYGETSIVTLADGSYAVGFIARIGNQHDAPQNDSYHLQIQIIDPDGNVVDLDARESYSTISPDRQPGSYYDYFPSGVQMTADGDGNYSLVLSDSFPFDFSNPGPLYRATVAHGNDQGLTTPTPISPTSSSDYPTHMSYGVDIAMLSSGQYMVSMGTDGIDGTSTTGNMVAVSINGAAPVIVDAATGFSRNNQITSISALGDGAVVVWNDSTADPAGSYSSGYGVLGAILDADGNVLHTFEVNQTEYRPQWIGSAQAVAELDGGFVVAWMAQEDDPNYALPYNNTYYRVFNADGTPRTNEIVLGNSQAGEQSGPAVIGLPGGGFAITWSDWGAIRLQQFDDAGAEIGPETAVGNGGSQSITLGPDGNLAISYFSNGGLYVQVMEANSAPTDIELSANTIAESPDQSALNTLIGSVAAIDDNAGDTFTYELTDNADGFFRLDGANLYWNTSTRPDHEGEPSYVISVKATDASGESVTRQFTIDVTDVNEAVVGLLETTFTVVENAAIGTVIATLAGDDPDAGETFTYEIVDGDGLPFTIVGSELRQAAVLDYEADEQDYYISVRVTDSADNSTVEQILVQLTDVNEAPTAVELSEVTVAENAAAGTVVGDVSGADPDDGDELSFALIDDADGRFALVNGQIVVAAGASLNFETGSTQTITIEVTDLDGLSYEQDIEISLADVNEAPTDIALTANMVAETSAAGTVVGTLSAVDPDTGDTKTFSIVGDGGPFAITNGQIVIAQGASLDFETTQSYEITIRVTDGDNVSYDEVLQIGVTNVTETITGSDDAKNPDSLKGFAYEDILIGLAGNDTLEGGGGADELNGGKGLDTASYAGASAGVTASLAKPSLNTGDAEGDTYIDVENLLGSAFNDILTGDKKSNRLDGGLGDDDLTGSAGKDIFVFGKDYGIDTIADFAFKGKDQDSVDLSDASGIKNFKDLMKSHVDEKKGDVIITADDDAVLIIEDTRLKFLEKGDFDF